MGRWLWGRVLTLWMIARSTRLEPRVLQSRAAEVTALHREGFDPQYYAFNHLEGEQISPYWHYVLHGRGNGLRTAPERVNASQPSPLVAKAGGHLGGPAFSIIMPTRDRRILLEHAVNSILCQTMCDYEAIIVDDGSIDGTADWLRSKYPNELHAGRLRLIEGVGEGAGAARNRALARAQGRWVAYLDSDNYWLPDHLAVHAEAHAAGAEACLTLAQDKRAITPNYDRSLHLQRTLGDMNGFSHRRSLLELAGGFDERLERYEDYDLILRLGRTTPIQIHSNQTFVYKIQPDSLSVRVPVRVNRSRLQDNHALERMLMGLDRRNLIISSGAANSEFGKRLFHLQRWSDPDAPSLVFVTPGEAHLAPSGAIYVIGHPGNAPHWANIWIATDGPLTRPRLHPAEFARMLDEWLLRTEHSQTSVAQS